MANAADKLADLYVIRQLILQRLVGGEQVALNRQLDAIADRLEAALKSGDLSGMSAKRLNQAISQLGSIVQIKPPAIGELAKAEADFTAGAFAQIGLDLTLPSEATLSRIASFSLVQGATMGDWFSRLQTQTRFELARNVKLGVSLGETNAQIAKRILSQSDKGSEVFAKTRRDANAIVRTSVSTISNEVRQATYAENSEVVEGVQWLSTLDGRTSDICIARSGLVWTLPDYKPKGHNLPWGGGPPAHWNCRSTSIPYLPPLEEMGIDPSKVPPAMRSSIDGQVAQDLSFSDFLKSKPAEFADEMLGKGRAQLWRDGKITLNQLLDQRGNPLTLAQLQQIASPTKAAKQEARLAALAPKPPRQFYNADLNDDNVPLTNRKDMVRQLGASAGNAASDNRYYPQPQFKGSSQKHFGSASFDTNLTDEAASMLAAIQPELDAMADAFNIPKLRGYRSSSSKKFNGAMGDGVLTLSPASLNSYARNVNSGAVTKALSVKRERIATLSDELSDMRPEVAMLKQKAFDTRADADWLEYEKARSAYNAKVKQYNKLIDEKDQFFRKVAPTSDWTPDSSAQKPWSAKSYARSGVEEMRSLLYHEFAHHVHQNYQAAGWLRRQDGAPPVERLLKTIFSKIDKKKVPSAYGETDPYEWFAENFALYMTGRKNLVQAEAAELIERLLNGETI